MMKKIVWLVCVLVITTTVFASERIKGNGTLLTQTIPVDSYDKIHVGNGIESNGSTFNWFRRNKSKFPVFEYKQTKGKAELEITLDENLWEILDIKQDENTLYIKAKEDYLMLPTQMIIKGTSGNLTQVKVTGCMDFEADTHVSVENISFSLDGVGEIKFSDLSSKNIKCNVSGVGKIYLTGSSDEGEFHLSGVGKIYASDFIVENLNCDVSGVGRMEVNASSKLSAQASGVGNIRYKGEPNVDSSVSGVGRIKPL